MRNRLIPFLGAILVISASMANANIIVVNTADNLDFSAGHTNLVYALRLLANGDTINFAIPGTTSPAARVLTQRGAKPYAGPPRPDGEPHNQP